MPQVKMVNPAGHLLLVNGGKKMRKRKPAATSATKRRKRNPSTGKTRRVSIKVNGRKPYARKRRNPSALAGMGLISDAFYAAAGGLLTAFVRGMVPVQFGGAVGDAAISGGVAIGLGELVGRFWNRNAGKMVTLGGVTVAATNLLSGYGLTPQALFSPKPAAKAVPPGVNAGVGDIGLFPRFGNPDPYYGTAVKVGNGMGDIALRPRA